MDLISFICFILSFFQVVERVTVFVMDTNDEKPEFKNMPAIIDVLEVSYTTFLFLRLGR